MSDLTQAVQANNLETVLEIHLGGLFNMRVNDSTLLHIACKNNSEEVVDYILSQPGIDINYINNDRKSPIDYAISNNNFNITQKILSQAKKFTNDIVRIDLNTFFQHVGGDSKIANLLQKEVLTKLTISDFLFDNYFKYDCNNYDIFKYMLLVNMPQKISIQNIFDHLLKKEFPDRFFDFLFKVEKDKFYDYPDFDVDLQLINKHPNPTSILNTIVLYDGYLPCMIYHYVTTMDIRQVYDFTNIKGKNSTKPIRHFIQFYSTKNHIDFDEMTKILDFFRFSDYNMFHFYPDPSLPLDPRDQAIRDDLLDKISKAGFDLDHFITDAKPDMDNPDYMELLYQVRKYKPILYYDYDCDPLENPELNFYNLQNPDILLQILEFEEFPVLMNYLMDYLFIPVTFLKQNIHYVKVGRIFRAFYSKLLKDIFIVNSEELTSFDPIEEIPNEHFILLENGVAWDQRNLSDYIIKSRHMVNKFCDFIPLENLRGKPIWSEDDLIIFRSRSDSKYFMSSLFEDLLIRIKKSKLFDEFNRKEIEEIRRCCSIFWARGAWWKNELLKYCSDDEIKKWNEMKSGLESLEMPSLPSELKANLATLKSMYLQIFSEFYKGLNDKQKIQMRDLMGWNEERLNNHITGKSCIMRLGSCLHIILQKMDININKMNKKILSDIPKIDLFQSKLGADMDYYR